MTTPASGAISLSDVNVELCRTSSNSISLSDSEARTLLNTTSGAISMSSGYSRTRVGYVDTLNSNFTNRGTYGQFRVRVLGCPANAQIFIELIGTTSGNPLGTSQYYSTCDASGNTDFTTLISNSDSYWFPASRTNQFWVRQANSILIGGFTASS